ncbi:MFS transporter [Streptomyces chrestomyceticus JCM 4735]|uniref:MFS transporter n=1 Tax=Streptomyces chrestomyceticus JCM 4735 TaxID=1306181 RepID=A0A7U9KP99_9ACTN|nr:MFS transporter [Streptomyces chrestomyceticus]GCD32846.1 MFS transporter [Streptomyces chrestomyceticus JCM 4735]
MRLWAATAAANLGDGLVLALIPLLAVQLTASSGLVAGAKLAHTLPWAVAPLAVGLLVDSMDRRQLIIFFDLFRAAALAVLLAALLLHATALFVLYALYLVACCLAVGEAVADIATTALVPSVVPRHRLEWANSWIRGTESVLNEFVGLPLGGLLVAVGPAWAVGGAGGLYAAAACAMLMLHGKYRPVVQDASPDGLDGRRRHLLTAGLRILWRNRPLRTLTLMSTVMAGCWSAWLAVLVVYTVQGPVGLSPFGYGLLLTTLGAGAVLGAALAPRLARTLGVRWILVTDVVAGVVMLGAPAVSADVVVIAFATFLGGVGSGLWNVEVISLRQRLTPQGQLGRISGAIRCLGWGGMPLGAALAAGLAELTGPRPVFALAAVLTALTLIPLLRILNTPALDAPAQEPSPAAGKC